MSRVSSAKIFVRKNLFRKSICRRKFSFSSSDVLNINFVVTVFDPNNNLAINQYNDLTHRHTHQTIDVTDLTFKTDSILTPRYPTMN